MGIEKEHGLGPDSKMVVLHDFTPCVDDELEVKRGQIVNILYRENDWVYIIGQDTRQEGFIPHSYCAPYNSQLADLAIKKKLPRNGSVVPGVENQLSEYSEMENHPTNDINIQNNLKHSQASLNSEPGISQAFLCHSQFAIVMEISSITFYCRLLAIFKGSQWTLYCALYIHRTR